MAFLALASQKSLLSLQKSFVQMQQITLMNEIDQIHTQMGLIKRENPENYGENDKYIFYEEQDETLSEQKESLDSQITEIQQMIQSLTSQVKQEIQSSCKLNYAGGS